MGGFFELGRGDFETRTLQPLGGAIIGEGQADYAGLGALARFDFDNHGRVKNYVEASIRGGRLSLEHEARDFAGPGQGVWLATQGAYLGGHLSVGGVLELGASGRLDLFGKLLLTALSGDEAEIAPWTPVSFDRGWSKKIQAGGRLSRQLAPGLMAVASAVYERELDGGARAFTSGHPIARPDFGGGSGIGEIGLSWRSSGAVPLNLGLGLQGHAGARRGVSGNLQVSLEF
jgi:hypothetical protein